MAGGPADVVTCPAGADTEEGANRSGAYRIAWDAPEGVVTRLTETSARGVTTLYEGPDHATTITGRGGGDYHYQVAQVRDGLAREASSGCRVLVRPYPIEVALGFFGVGLTVTLLTVALVVVGHRAHKRGDIG
ncbi:MAG: hypothetical protein RIF41_34875 [Polyangiaceae bacterium]